MAFKSYKDKLLDFGLNADSFKDDGGKTVDYVQVVVRVQLDGEPEDIVLSGASAPKPKLLGSILRGSDNVVENTNLFDNR